MLSVRAAQAGGPREGPAEVRLRLGRAFRWRGAFHLIVGGSSLREPCVDRMSTRCGRDQGNQTTVPNDEPLRASPRESAGRSGERRVDRRDSWRSARRPLDTSPFDLNRDLRDRTLVFCQIERAAQTELRPSHQPKPAEKGGSRARPRRARDLEPRVSGAKPATERGCQPLNSFRMSWLF